MAGRRPMPREGRRGRGRLLLGLACAAALVALGLWAWAALAGGTAKEEAGVTDETTVPVHKVTHDSMCVTYTYDGEMIRWYVMIDPDTGVQYLVNDRGGCCVRLDPYRSPVGVSYE